MSTITKEESVNRTDPKVKEMMGSAKNSLIVIYNHVQIFKATKELSPTESYLRLFKSPKEGTQPVPFSAHRS